MLIYQIYPRSFFDINGDGIGDLAGITAKLPYLSKLGVQCLWISPFFKSPMKDFGYDVSDYCAVDPIFGTESDFDQLLLQAKRRGMGIMIDMVLSHSSDQHPWFLESSQNRKNDKANWYVWADPTDDGGPPNNWVSLFGGSAWEFSQARGQYYLHNFLKSQPDFNFHEPSVQQALLAACEFWLKKGVQGFRLDVCNFYFHSKGLENNSLKDLHAVKTDGVHKENPYNQQTHVFDKDRPENLSFLAELRKLSDRYPDSLLMGEVVSDNSLKIMADYISNGRPLQTAYCFALFRDHWNGLEIAKLLTEVEANLGQALPTWALGNHDVPRYVSRFGAADHLPQSTKCFLFFLFILRGHLILYQGDELGLTEAEIPRELMQDPFGIEFYPEFKGRDGCRTPMPWQAGTTGERLWLPIPNEHLSQSVELQETDKASVLKFTRALIKWRNANPWLVDSALRLIGATENTICIERQISPELKFVAALNASATACSMNLESIGQVRLQPFGFLAWELVFEAEKLVSVIAVQI